jgi:hypothetical protein
VQGKIRARESVKENNPLSYRLDSTPPGSLRVKLCPERDPGGTIKTKICDLFTLGDPNFTNQAFRGSGLNLPEEALYAVLPHRSKSVHSQKSEKAFPQEWNKDPRFTEVKYKGNYESSIFSDLADGEGEILAKTGVFANG